jgi:site-specific DNA-adenine methylase
MEVIKSPFRYVGSKWRLLKKINFDLPKFSQIIEPYAGSCSFSMNIGKSFVAHDTNIDLITLWLWLKETATERRLFELQETINQYPDKTDVRKIDGLLPGEITYIRINMTGLFVGQLSSWKIYKQFKLPIENTARCLPIIKNGTFLSDSASTYKPKKSHLIFIDPPYCANCSNYIDKSQHKNYDNIYNKIETKELIDKINSVGAKYIFTYGTTARKDFPNLKWVKVLSKKMPNTHKAGEFKIREEFISANIPFEVTR